MKVEQDTNLSPATGNAPTVPGTPASGYRGRHEQGRAARRAVPRGSHAAKVESMSSDELVLYAGLCGWALARAHARSGDRVQIAAYLGKSDRFDRAVADFAVAYADQNERDHTALCAAVASGRLPAV